MIETVLAFFAGVLISHWFIWPALLLCIWADHKESKFFTWFLFLLLAIGAFLIFQPTWKMVGTWLCVYLPIGFAWSFLRYRRYVGKLVRLHNKNELTKSALERMADITNNVDRVVFWVVMWPISVTQLIVSDLLDAIEHFITHTIRRAYDRIRDSALKGARLEPPK